MQNTKMIEKAKIAGFLAAPLVKDEYKNRLVLGLIFKAVKNPEIQKLFPLPQTKSQGDKNESR